MSSPADNLDAGNGDLGFRSGHDRSLFKRTHPHLDIHQIDRSKSSDRHLAGVRHRARRKMFQFKAKSLIYSVIFLAVFGFAFASMVLQSSITSVFRTGSEHGRMSRHGLRFATSLKFVPARRFQVDGFLDRFREVPLAGIRPPKLALILGNMERSPESLMLFTVMKNLRQIGYMVKLYALKDGATRTIWEEIGGQMTILSLERYGHFDWSLFDGVVAESIEAEKVISSLMQEPFCSVPLIWIIQEDRLGKRLIHYNEMGWGNLTSQWRHSFNRADVIVFPDFSLPMLYSVLDGGNFFVIPGSPRDVWAGENYANMHSKHDLRKSNGYGAEDIVVLVVGNSIFFDELWDYAAVMQTIGPLLIRYAKGKDTASFKFIFLCGNSTNDYNEALEDVAARLRLSSSSMRQYSFDHDVNGVVLMADIVLYGSSQDEQAFPSLLTRAMSFGIPVVAPDLPIIKRYIIDGVHGVIFSKHNPDDMLRAFSLLISSDGKLSNFAEAVGSTGKLHARNLLAFESVTGYAKLLENVLNFPSDVFLPAPISEILQDSWEWDSFGELMEQTAGSILDIGIDGSVIEEFSIINMLEEDFNSFMALRNTSEYSSDNVEQDFVSVDDLSAVEQMMNLEEFERREMDLIEERMGKDPGVWDDIYRNARKAEKLKFEANERDEGALERIGRLMCIYEVYNGAGAWPFLHHGSLYRGLSLSTRARRLSSDDVDAVYRLPFLNDTHYRDLLCEMGGMFSIAYKVDEIHKIPWIGFQSWQAFSRKVSLSLTAERVLDETVQHKKNGDAVYFWTRLDMGDGSKGMNDSMSFWSMCDILNGGHCRMVFQNAFRHMYSLPSNVEALPPMPEDHGHWSALHSWVMPTSSFLEFIMFSRMFADSLDAVNRNGSQTTQCLLGFSVLEKKHCYCRILEVLVNVWAYHSARRMVYIDPHTGLLEEQHPVEQRKGVMWVKYFNFTILKSMDEDLAEAADDGDVQREDWLWPLTGEVHWQGIYEREREQRYRVKMDKKRKIKEKLFERMKYGYRQKTLGG